MSAEMMTGAVQSVQAAAEAVRTASLITRAKDLAQVHPVASVVVLAAAGAVVGGAVGYAGYKAMKKLFS